MHYNPAFRRTHYLLLAIALCLNLFILGPAAVTYADDPRATTGAWAPVLNWGVFGKHMALLPTGKVLVWPTGQDARVWDPLTQTSVPITSLFEPFSNTWTQGTPMTYARWYATSTTLPDGRILATSGDAPDGTRSNIPEIYNPATDSWTQVITANKDLGLYPLMYVLPNGKAYAAGTKSTTYLLDLLAGTWSNGPANAFGSNEYAESSAMYAPGKIIRAGGGNPAFANTAVVDMNAPAAQWRQLSPMNHARRRHNLTILADGTVMAVGGTARSDDLSGAVYEGEIWNPATETWTLTAAMTHDRMYHSTALLLPDGRVLTAGGEYAGRLNAQIFSPPYLFKGTRPAITAAPASVAFGAGFSIGFTTDGSSVDSVALVRPSAVTHAFDHNQRYVPLSFSVNGGTITATAPANGNVAPPGYYMLIVKDSKGVPSVAAWVRVDTSANLVPGTITGKVTESSNGNPLPGATISYSGGTTTTDANGDYTLANVPAGANSVTASLGGFATVAKIQIVGGGGVFTLNFALSPPGTITGKVTDSVTSDPLVGATITYSGGTATTDANGDYTIANISSGSATLAASADTYNSSPAQTVVVPANNSVTANFALTRKRTFIQGEIRDSITNQTLAGATVSYGGVVTTTDALGRYALDAAPGTYTVTVSLAGYTSAAQPDVLVTAGAYSSVDFSLDPVDPTQVFTPVADTYTYATNPGTNYGTSTSLKLDMGTNTYNSYMRFNVSGLTGPVKSAKVLFYVTNASDKGGAIYPVANTFLGTTTPWTEAGLTWNNAPAIGGAPLSSAGAAPLGGWVEVDVTPAIGGDGTYTFGLKATSSDQVQYNSREGGNPPQLVIRQDSVPAPIITAFAPGSGPVGTTVTITGTSFINVSGITFNGAPANGFMVDSATRIRAVVPNGATTGKIGVMAAGGSASSATNFAVTTPPSPPTIGSFTPASGAVGSTVMIDGASFSGVTGVTFNGVSANSFTIDSPTQIHAVVPSGATTGKVGVTTTAGAASSAADFVVTTPVPPPTISSFTPASGPAGATITIGGMNFNGATAVTFNGIPADSFTVDSATQIRAVVPNGATTGKIGVTTAAGAVSSAANFVVTAPATYYPIYLPLIKNGAAPAPSGARGEDVAPDDTWRTSGSAANICRLHE